MEKELVKHDNFMIKDKEVIEDKTLDEVEVRNLLSWDFSTVKPKKHLKAIQKLTSIVSSYNKYKDIKKKTDHFFQKVEQLQGDIEKLNEQKNNLSKGNKELENQKETVLSEIEAEKSTKVNCEKENQDLNLNIKELQQNIKTLEINNEKLSIENQKIKGEQDSLQLQVKQEQLKKEQYEARQKTLRLDINQLLENKTFYSETLSGHKKETIKILRVNIIFSFIIMSMIGTLLCFAYIFYKEGIEQIIEAQTKTQVAFLFLARGGVGVLFYFICKFLFKVLNKILNEIYQIFKGIRDIESSLILAREIALSTEKDTLFKSDEERRNYLSFFKLSVLKNHFINLNSLKKYLHIEDEKQKQIEDEN